MGRKTSRIISGTNKRNGTKKCRGCLLRNISTSTPNLNNSAQVHNYFEVMNNSGLPTIMIDLVCSYHLYVLINTLLQVRRYSIVRQPKMFSKAYAIFFHRLFGPIEPQTFEVLDVTIVRERLTWNILYCLCVSLRFQTEKRSNIVEEKVEMFRKGVEGGCSKRGQASERNLLDLPNR